MTITGIVEATVTVVVTTLDDAVWLVPYVGSASSCHTRTARIAHAITFLLTSQIQAVTCVVIGVVVSRGATAHLGGDTDDDNDDDEKKKERTEIVLGSIGAVLCWFLAAVFYMKKILKRRRRSRSRNDRTGLLQDTEELGIEVAENPNIPCPSPVGTGIRVEGSVSAADEDGTDAIPHESESTTVEEEHPPKSFTWSNVGTVVSLTTVGAIDEMSYYPALIVGKIFTPLELCAGTFLAANVVLAVVTCFLSRCKPLVDFLDRIPTYAVIGLFASILTLDVLYDVFVE